MKIRGGIKDALKLHQESFKEEKLLVFMFFKKTQTADKLTQSTSPGTRQPRIPLPAVLTVKVTCVPTLYFMHYRLHYRQIYHVLLVQFNEFLRAVPNTCDFGFMSCLENRWGSILW
jgi:hypothetical protein